MAFLLVAYAYAVLAALAALTVEEFSFHRYGRWRDLVVAGAVTVVENLGYRQMTAWWRVPGPTACPPRPPLTVRSHPPWRGVGSNG